MEKEVKRVQATRIPTIRMIGDRRYPKIRKTSSKYRIKVMIKEQIVPVYIDTGADVCVMSQQNANRLNLDIQETKMKIRPYGSRPKKCIGEYTGTVRQGDRIANAIIYIVKDKVETLLSGPVSEELGIISFKQEKKIRQIQQQDTDE